jgi:hypothetical protein
MNTNTITGNKFRLSADVIVNDFISETYKKFTLYPNPAKEYITIEYNILLNTDDPVLEIVTLKGLHKEAIRLTTGWGEKIMDLRNYTSGTYLVRLYINGKSVESKKFVKL